MNMNILDEFFGDPLKQTQKVKQPQQGDTGGRIIKMKQGIGRRVARFDNLVLTPLLVSFALFAIGFLFQRAWLFVGLFLVDYLVLTLVGGSLLGASFPQAKSLAEMKQYRSADKKKWKPDSEMSPTEIWTLRRAIFVTAAALGVTAGVLIFHRASSLAEVFGNVAVFGFGAFALFSLIALPSSKPSGPPRAKARRWDAVLSKCDLVMARDEIAAVHKQLNEEAKRKYGEYVLKNENLTNLDAFCNNPNIETARAFLDVAPDALPYFEACSPGGGLYSTNRHISERGR